MQHWQLRRKITAQTYPPKSRTHFFHKYTNNLSRHLGMAEVPHIGATYLKKKNLKFFLTFDMRVLHHTN